MAWISNHTRCFVSNVIAHPCFNCMDSLQLKGASGYKLFYANPNKICDHNSSMLSGKLRNVIFPDNELKPNHATILHITPQTGVLLIGTRFTKVLWIYHFNLAKLFVVLTCQIMMSSGHNYIHATTTVLSYVTVPHLQHDWIAILEPEKKYIWLDFNN